MNKDLSLPPISSMTILAKCHRQIPWPKISIAHRLRGKEADEIIKALEATYPNGPGYLAAIGLSFQNLKTERGKYLGILLACSQSSTSKRSNKACTESFLVTLNPSASYAKVLNVRKLEIHTTYYISNKHLLYSYKGGKQNFSPGTTIGFTTQRPIPPNRSTLNLATTLQFRKILLLLC
jgi:hypothetical protein